MERITRRELAKRGLIGAAALALPITGIAQQEGQEPQEAKPEEKPDPRIDEKAAMIEKQLAKPLDERAKGLLKRAIKDAEGTAEARMKHKLPENSEPCFVYLATPAKGGVK
jgi:hypothetical protein